MLKNITVKNVLISSPGDVASYKKAIVETIYLWNSINTEKHKLVLLPMQWERDAYSDIGDGAQSVINKQLVKKCDLIIGVFWNRIGTRTKEYVSGSVEEIELAIKGKKPCMVYFCNEKKESIDEEQKKLVEEYKKDIGKRMLYYDFLDIDELQKLIINQLGLKYKKYQPKEKKIVKKIKEVKLPPKMVTYKILTCIFEYNNSGKKPQKNEIALKSGISVVSVQDYLNILENGKYIYSEYPAGKNGFYSIRAMGRELLSRFR
jgi:hypothetical protein